MFLTHLLTACSTGGIRDMEGLCLLTLVLFIGGRASSSSSSSSCPVECVCYNGVVDCSSKSLTTSSLPQAFPSDTTDLRFHNNHLTSLPYGTLDHLTTLHSISLHGNPWACDCGILYLRAWLLRQHTNIFSHSGIICSSPPDLRGRLVAHLSEEEVLDSCHYWYCDLALASQVCLFVFVLVQVALLVALVVFMRRFEDLSKEAKRTTEESLTADESQREFLSMKDTDI